MTATRALHSGVILSLTILATVAISAIIVANEYRSMLIAQRDQLRSEVVYLGHVVQTPLRQGHFDEAQQQLRAWARLKPSTDRVVLRADNGYVIEEFQNDPPAVNSITDTQTLSIGYRGTARLQVSRSLDQSLAPIYSLAAQLAAIVLAVALITQILLRQIQRYRHQVDITNAEVARRELAQAAVEQSENTLRNVIAGADLGFWDWYYQTGEHYVSDRWLSILGLGREEITNTAADWSERIHPDDKAHVASVVEHAIDRKTPYRVEFRMKHRLGHWVWVEGSGAVIETDPESGEPVRLCGIHQEIEQRKRAEQELKSAYQQVEKLATLDSLTKLPNRHLLERDLTDRIAQADRFEQMVAVLFIDLDNFKIVNDTFGHEAGDELLISVAGRMRDVLRAYDLLVRFGGDEFVIVLSNVASTTEVEHVAQKVVEALKPEVNIAGNDLYATASIGISLFPNDGKTPGDLLKQADAAMYRAKQSGRNAYRFFTPEINQAMAEWHDIEVRLREAIRRHDLCLHYQPQVDATNGRITSCEALLRWHSPDGLMSAAEFIRIAEQSSLIDQIDDFVIEEALSQRVLWKQLGIRDLRVDINVSARRLRTKDDLQQLGDRIVQLGLTPRDIGIEITEHSLVDATRANVERLASFRDRGFTVSLDDFGTGFSSLGNLKSLPIDVIKIDRAFIAGLPDNAKDRAIVDAVLAMGRGLGMRVTAEGVETADQYDYVAQHGCHLIQGYYFHKPLDPEQFTAVLINDRPERSGSG